MAGSKINDQPNKDGKEQEYQFSLPYISPSGHEFSFYDTPENERLVVKHTSGSHLEFKADGSVIIKAVKDLHTHASVLSSQSTTDKGADNTTLRYDADLTLNVGGRLFIKCASLDMEVGSYANCIAGTDFSITSNNIIEKATESISLEATKSVYLDTKEYKERVVTNTTEVGTNEDAGVGGYNYMHVNGNTIIQNDDINGGITIKSRGYLNFVCGQERVDVVGQYIDLPSTMGRATWTQSVFTPTVPAVGNISRPGGDYFFSSASSRTDNIAMTMVSPTAGGAGKLCNVFMGDEMHNVLLGNRIRLVGLNENVLIAGIQKITAAKIFLN